jgi:hypothetical protein
MNSRKRASTPTKNGNSGRICAFYASSSTWTHHRCEFPSCVSTSSAAIFSDVQKRYDDYIAEGVTEVWLVDPDLKRAYTVTKAEGLREFRGGTLRLANPPWKSI